VECPDTKCVKSLDKCEVNDSIENDLGPNNKLKEREIFITKKLTRSEIVVGLESQSGKQSFGRVVFPKGTFEADWTVFITNSKKTTNKSNNKGGGCGKKKKDNDKKVASVPFDITVRDSKGKKVNIEDLKSPIQLFIYSKISNKVCVVNGRQAVILIILSFFQKSVCFAYSRDDEEGYQCLPSSNFTNVGNQDSGVKQVQSSTTHLTSFAVLLGSPGGSNNGCDSSIYWILSTSFLAAAIVIVILAAIASRSRRVLKAVYGHSVMDFTKIKGELEAMKSDM